MATDFIGLMTRSTPIHDDEEGPESFTDNLEQRARAVVATSHQPTDDLSASSILEDEIALTLNQIDELRRRDKGLKEGLFQEECDIGTELLQMEQRTPRYSWYRYPEREKLQRRRSRIKEHQRRLTQIAAEKLDALHNRLLSLLSKHRQLGAA